MPKSEHRLRTGGYGMDFPRRIVVQKGGGPRPRPTDPWVVYRGIDLLRTVRGERAFEKAIRWAQREARRRAAVD